MKIIFFGEDTFSNVVLQSLIDAKHEILLVATPFYENLIYKKLELTSKKHDIPFVRSRNINGIDFIELVRGKNPELIVSAHFERLIKKDLLSIPSKGCINLHPSLLPNYRGMAPQHWPIVNRESDTAVTVHYIDEGIDTGDIILQIKTNLNDSMYVSDLLTSFLNIYKYIVKDAVALIEMGSINIKKQSHLTGSYYHKLKRNECEILDDFDVQKAYAYIRAFSKPYYGAYYKDIIIWRAHIPSVSTSLALKNNNKYIGIDHIDGMNVLILKDGLLIIDKYEKFERGSVENFK